MNSGNSKTSDPHKLLLNLSDKVNLKRKDNIRLYQILASTMHGKKLKSHTKTIDLIYQLQRGTKNLGLPDHILYQIFKTILNIPLKYREKRLTIFSKKICQQNRKQDHI